MIEWMKKKLLSKYSVLIKKYDTKILSLSYYSGCPFYPVYHLVA